MIFSEMAENNNYHAAKSQPRLFDTGPFKISQEGRKPVEKLSEPSKHPPKNSEEEQLPLYLEYSSTREHLDRALYANIRRDDNPRILDVLKAGKSARALLKNDYAALIEILNGVCAREGKKKKITDTDLEGAKHYTTPAVIEEFTKEYGIEPPAVGVIIPRKKWRGRKKIFGRGRTGIASKLGRPKWSAGANLHEPGLLQETPFRKSGVALVCGSRLSDNACSTRDFGMEHELIHSAHDLYEAQCNQRTHPSGDELYLIPRLERNLVNEISAYRSQATSESIAGKTDIEKLARRRVEWDYVKKFLKKDYIPMYEKASCKRGFDKERVRSVMEIMQSRIDDAVDAVCYLQDSGISERALSKILIAVGPTREELSRGEFYSPLNDVVAWGEYLKQEVAAAAGGKKVLPAKKA